VHFDGKDIKIEVFNKGLSSLKNIKIQIVLFVDPAKFKINKVKFLMDNASLKPIQYKKRLNTFEEMDLKKNLAKKTVTAEMVTDLNRRAYLHFWFRVGRVLSGGESYKINILKNNKVIHSIKG
jgi:hypothetical protein